MKTGIFPDCASGKFAGVFPSFRHYLAAILIRLAQSVCARWQLLLSNEFTLVTWVPCRCVWQGAHLQQE